MNETAAKAMPSTSHSHGNGLNGGCSAGFAERAASLNSLEGLADEASKRFAASSLETWVRSAGTGVGLDTTLSAAPGESEADAGDR